MRCQELRDAPISNSNHRRLGDSVVVRQEESLWVRLLPAPAPTLACRLWSLRGSHTDVPSCQSGRVMILRRHSSALPAALGLLVGTGQMPPGGPFPCRAVARSPPRPCLPTVGETPAPGCPQARRLPPRAPPRVSLSGRLRVTTSARSCCVVPLRSRLRAASVLWAAHPCSRRYGARRRRAPRNAYRTSVRT